MTRRRRPLNLLRLEDRLTPAGPLYDAVVAWYPGEGSAADRTGSHPGHLVNGTTFGPGRVGRAFQLDGVDDRVVVPNSPDLDRTDAASYEAWVNFDRVPTGIMSVMAISGPGNDLDLQVHGDGRIRFYVRDGGSVATGTTAVQPGQWYHVVATFEAGGRIRLFVNKTLEAELIDARGPRVPGGNPLVIGDNAAFPGRPFAGRIDEPTVYNRALTADEVVALYDAGESGKESLSPVATALNVPHFNLDPVTTGDAATIITHLILPPDRPANSPQPTGTVDFFAHPAGSPGTIIPLGSAPVNPDTLGTAVLSRVIDLAPGRYTVTARYYGDITHSPGESPAAEWTVAAESSGVATTTTVTGLGSNSIRPGGSVVVGVEVASASGTPGGDVEVIIRDEVVARGTLGANGRAAVIAAVNLPNGTYPVLARYLGSGDFDASRSADGPDLTVGATATATTVTGLTQPTVRAGQPVVVGVAVTAADGSAPAGEVVVFAGATEVGRAALNGRGRAAVTITPNLPSGSYPVVAVFAGGANYAFSRDLEGRLLEVIAPGPVPLPVPAPKPAPGPGAPVPGLPGAAAVQVVYLNFDGGSAGDALGPNTVLTGIPAFRTADVKADGRDRQGVIDAIVAGVRRHFAPYAVTFTTTRPPSGEYMEVVIGGEPKDARVRVAVNDPVVRVKPQLGDNLLPLRDAAGAVRLVGPVSTVYGYLSGRYDKSVNYFSLYGAASGVDNGNLRKNDFAVVFSDQFRLGYNDPGEDGQFNTADDVVVTADGRIRRLVVTLAHEVGHNLGLAHLDDALGADDVMKAESPRAGDEQFRDRPVKLLDSAATQNSAEYLRTFAGPRGGGTSLDARAADRRLTLDLSGLGGPVYDLVVGVPGSQRPSGAPDDVENDWTVRLPGGRDRVALTLPAGTAFWFTGSSVPGGPVDVFSGAFPGDARPLFDAAGRPNPAVPVSIGEVGAAAPLGTARLEDRSGFARRAPGDAPPSETRYAVTGAADGTAFVRVFDAEAGAEYAHRPAFEDGFAGPVSVAQADVNADGVLDVLVAAGAGGGPRVRVFDGVTLRPLAGPLADFLAFEGDFRGGVSVAAADVDGDGFVDVVAGAGEGGGPRVRVFSGANGAVLVDQFVYEESFRGGVNVAAGDVDGDGRAEVVVGSGRGGGPRIRMFRGSTLVREWFAFEESFRGGVSVAVGDTNNDGVVEVLAGAGSGGGPRVGVFSGDGTRLADLLVFEPDLRTGVRVATATTSDSGATPPALVVTPAAASRRVKLIDSETGETLADEAVFDLGMFSGAFVG